MDAYLIGPLHSFDSPRPPPSSISPLPDSSLLNNNTDHNNHNNYDNINHMTISITNTVSPEPYFLDNDSINGGGSILSNDFTD